MFSAFICPKRGARISERFSSAWVQQRISPRALHQPLVRRPATGHDVRDRRGLALQLAAAQSAQSPSGVHERRVGGGAIINGIDAGLERFLAPFCQNWAFVLIERPAATER